MVIECETNRHKLKSINLIKIYFHKFEPLNMYIVHSIKFNYYKRAKPTRETTKRE